MIISDTWGIKRDRVEKLHDKLVAKGINTCYEKQDMEAAWVTEKMAAAIDGASLILSCSRKNYMHSTNFQKEVFNKDSQKKPVIYLKMDKEMRVEDWLSLVMGDSVFLDASGDDVEDALDRVVIHVEKTLAAIKNEKEPAVAIKLDSQTVGHSAEISAATAEEAPQKQRTVYFEKWTKEEVAQWVREEEIA